MALETESNLGDSISESWKLRKQNANALAAGYDWKKRSMEWVSATVFSVSFVLGLIKTLPLITVDNLWMCVVACLLSMGFADIFSGLLHWAADTWGDMKTPVFSTFIRSFREHHVDPFQITRHDAIETNGDTCLVLIPVIIALNLGQPQAGSDADVFILVFGISVSFWVVVTNQIHKWAHMLHPPFAIKLLQNARILLNRKDHQVHHHTPFDRYYCITNGWLNGVLASFGFWKRMELAISSMTGAKPRADDAFWTVQKE